MLETRLAGALEAIRRAQSSAAALSPSRRNHHDIDAFLQLRGFADPPAMFQWLVDVAHTLLHLQIDGAALTATALGSPSPNLAHFRRTIASLLRLLDGSFLLDEQYV